MKIAIFHNLPLGGAKKVVYEQAKYFSQHGHQVDLYQLAPIDNYYSFEKYTNKIYNYKFYLKTKLPSWLSRLENDFNNFVSLANLHKKVAQEIDSKSYDMVIVHPDKYTQAPFILRYLTTKSIYYCHEWLRIIYEPEFAFKKNVSPLKKMYEKITREIRKNIDKENILAADIVLSNSAYTARNIKNAYGITAHVAYPGVDTQIFQPGNTKKKYDVLFVGDKTDEEGYKLLLEIEKVYQKKIIIKTISRKNNSFRLNDEDLAEEYNKARVVLCLSVNEPFGLIPLEAMACGVTVIAINDGGYRETIIDGKTGYLVQGDSKIIGKKLEYLLSNEKNRSTMGENGREHVVRYWAWKNTINKLEEFLIRNVES